ncbi:peptidoglycan DD-metalloendopeptidase family protein [Streptomyces sp. NPDC057494]|uniref:peptidoglycan DD-metalloendopeptidase family protein n=1 Tax=Streptomyces sp. NPDC057494 TaxID=3346148 RepID=UPI003694408B
MAVRGRHRRHQPSRINRASLTVTAGGAGMALPLIGAGAAQAASLDVWEKVASCESSSSWHINTGNGYFGGLQFSQSTWEQYGGTHYAPRADLASKDQQIAIAERVLKGQGPGAWPSCSPDAGLARGGESPGVTPRRATAAEPTGGGNDVRTASLPGQRLLPERPARSASPTTVPTVREMYTVTPGDSLSKIAVEEHVKGGWQRLYEANRRVVGDDPDLILPGQRLTLRITAPKSAEKAESAEKAGKPEKPEKAEKAERKAAENAAPATKAAPSPQTARPVGAAPTKAAHPRTVPSQAPVARPSTKPSVKPAPKPTAQPSHKPVAQPKPSHKPVAQPKPKPAHKPVSHPKPKPAAKPSGDGYSAPVSADIGTRYGTRGSSWSSGYHTGVDFPVPTGTSVKAVAGGRVVSAGWGGAYGYQIVLRHADGRYSQYAHLSALTVREGQRVQAGQRIARSGSTGNSSGPHLHFEIRTGPGYGSDIDPLAYLRARGVSV